MMRGHLTTWQGAGVLRAPWQSSLTKKQESAKEHHLGIHMGDIQAGLDHTDVEAASLKAAARGKNSVQALQGELKLVRG